MKPQRTLPILLSLILPLSAFADTETVDGITWTYTVSNGKASLGGGDKSSPAIATSTTGSIAIPSTLGGYSVTTIGAHAFRGCSELTSITIPNGVTSIEYCAFYDCSGLTSITIPNSVTSIGGRAFCGCSGLTSITIPDSVTSTGRSAFFGCSGLTSITIPDSVTSIGDSAFSGCSAVRDIVVPGRFEMSSIFPSSYRSITNAVLADGVTSIGNYAFSGCSGLTSVTIPDGVTSIGDRAFEGCSGLTSITIPSSVSSIGDAAFFRCSGLTSITIPSSVTEIGRDAFEGCSGLTSITIPSSVTEIGRGAFSGCSGLTSITIPDSVTSIGNYAFSGCSGLASLFVNDGNPVYNSRNGCNAIIETGTGVLVAGCRNTIIPDSVTSIGDSAFFRCSGLTSITIPDSVTSIGDSAFSGCSELTSITIPDSVTSIGDSAFDYCSGLTSITIPDSVTEIGWGAFEGCSGLTSITIPSSVTEIGRGAFEGCSGLKSITIPDSVTSIGDSAFLHCSGLTTIMIPDSVTNIGEKAFDYCSGLTSVTIPDGVTIDGAKAFDGCFGIRKAVVPGQFLMRRLFPNSYSSITNLFIVKGVTSIGSSAFSGCSGLTSVTIPDSVTSIGNYAFSDCSGLSAIAIPPSVSSVGASAFSGCTELSAVFIPESLEGQTEAWGVPEGCRIVVGLDVSIEDVPVPKFWIFEQVPAALSTANDNWEAAARSTAANGANKVWECYVAGLDPADPEEKFLAEVFLDENGEPQVSWTPDLSQDRVYVVDGKSALSDDWGVPDGESRFFRVRVAMPGGFGDATISFDSAGGTEVAPITAAVGEALVEPMEPERAALLFAGWSPAFPATMPLGGATLTAQWTADPGFFKWTLAGNSVTITGVNRTPKGRMDIPAEIDGHPVTGIGSEAFSQCNQMTEVSIPSSVKSIGYAAFSGCSSLSKVHISDLAAWCGISFGSYNANPCALAGHLFLNGEEITDLVVPDDVKSIGRYAFYCCSGLRTVTIPDSVTSIDESAFSECSGLISAWIGDRVATIGSYAFYHCSRLATISIPERLVGWIASNAIPSGCRIVVRYTISFDSAGGTAVAPITAEEGSALVAPAAPTKAGCDFAGWSPSFPSTMPSRSLALTAQWTPRRYTISFDSAGGSAIASITATYGSALTAPAAPTKNGYTFAGWSPAFPATMPLGGATLVAQWVKTQDYTITFDSAGGTAVASITAAYGSALTAPTAPTKNGYDFAGWSPAFPETMPAGNQTLIAQWTPRQYTITFDSAGGTAVASITAAYGASLTPPTVPTKNGYMFAGWSPTFPSTMPMGGAILTAQWTVNSSYFKRTVSNGYVTITGVNETPTGALEIPARIDGVPVGAIGENAFNNCQNLTSVTIPAGVTTIGGEAFYYCRKMTTITIPSSVTTIGGAAFSYCYALESLTIPFGVTSIGNSAFSHCGLTSITIPNSVTSIGTAAFCYSDLTSISIPDSMTSIGDSMFSGCRELTSVAIPNSVTSIGRDAFQGCSKLMTITIPSSVLSIGNDAFFNCSNLTLLSLPGRFRGNTSKMGIPSGCTVTFRD